MAIPLSVIWIVAITNAVNLIDGLDGLAVGVATISSLTMLVIAMLVSEGMVALMMAALAGGRGQTLFVENMFESRYRHVPQLQRMGADIRVQGRSAVVTGCPLHGQRVGEHRPAGRGRAGGGRPGGGGDHSGDPAEPHPPGLSGYGGNSSAAGSGHPPAPYKQKYRRRPWHL